MVVVVAAVAAALAALRAEHDREFPLFIENLNVRMVEAGCHIPVNAADIISCLVFAYFAKSHAAAFKSRMILTRENMA